MNHKPWCLYRRSSELNWILDYMLYLAENISVLYNTIYNLDLFCALLSLKKNTIKYTMCYIKIIITLTQCIRVIVVCRVDDVNCTPNQIKQCAIHYWVNPPGIINREQMKLNLSTKLFVYFILCRIIYYFTKSSTIMCCQVNMLHSSL